MRFAGVLATGPNRLLVQVATLGAAVEFSLAFRLKSTTAAHDQLSQAALTQFGNVERGRMVFFDAEKSLCVKCHQVGDYCERIGPELTGIGARFGRVYLIESILDPSRAMVPGCGTLRVVLSASRVLTGMKAAETDATLTLADNEGKKYDLKKADVTAQKSIAVSTMLDSLEKRLTEQEFIDLVVFLVSLKERNH